MKKFYLFLLVVLMASMSLSAQVYYLLPNSNEWNSEEVINPYRNTKISQDQLQWEESEGPQNPERVAYDWFRDVYCAGIPMSHTHGTVTDDADTKRVITFKDLTDGRLEANGDLFSSVKVLWVNVDRNMSVGALDGLFPQSVRDRLANYVKAGGNLYLSTYASRLVFLINRGPEPGFKENQGFSSYGINDPWLLLVNFGAGYDNHGHRIFKPLNDNSKYGHHGGKDYDTYVMQSSSTRRTDRNCLWDIEDNTSAVSSFQTAHTCHVFGSWGHNANFTSAGLVEFYPVGDWKGTVICNGLAACSFAEANEAKDNVKLLTQGILDYLSAAPDVTWGEAPTTGSIAPGTTVTITPVLNAASKGKATIIHYVTSSADIVDYHDLSSAEPGAVYYNYFGTATLSAKVQGDGVHFPKNEITAATTHSITVNGGTVAEPRFAYVLPYPFNVISDANYDRESGKMPDFETAKWFYEQFIRDGIAYKDVTRYGCFIRPSDLASLPSSVKVLWIHNDHCGQTSESYYTDLGGNTFVTALQNFVANNGNVFVSKQATRLVSDLGRNDYPIYPNNGYENCDSWRIGNHWNLSGTEIDHSSHAVYAGLVKDYSGSTVIMNAGRHTNNNHIWKNWGALPGQKDAGRLSGYQDAHNCRILGAWGHYNESDPISDELECVGFAEYYPQENVTLKMGGEPYNQLGTIMAMGLAAYHWADPTDQIKTLTRDILYYLNIDEVPAFNWIKEPENGEIESDQIVQVEYKATDIRWESSNSDIVEITPDPSNPSDPDYKKLLLKAEGSATISAIRYADGYLIPKNVQGSYVLSKTIQVTPYIYTRDVPADHYGTICLPRASASLSDGMTVYRVLSDETDGIMLEEVNAMEAGVPYFFYSTANRISVTMTGAAELIPKNGNGLIGNFGPASVEIPNETDNYILGSDNTLYYIDQAGIMLGANRAYLDRSTINQSTPSGMPKRVMGIHKAPSVATALDNTGSQNILPVKKLINGRLVIQVGDQLYDVTGTQVK